MIKIETGNILNCSEDIIVHQVNVQGIMGGGVAKQLALQYPKLEEDYAEHCRNLDNNYKHLRGNVFFYRGQDNKIICNMFSQEKNFDTDYEAMKKALNYIKKWAENNNLSIAIPYRNRVWNSKWKLGKGI